MGNVIKIAESNMKNAPVLIDAVFPIFFIIKRTGNCSAIHASCDRDAMETISAGEKFLTMVKNKESIAM